MFCGNCGKKIPDAARFCPECGHVVAAPAAPKAPAASQTPVVPQAPVTPFVPEVKAPETTVFAAPAAPAEKKEFKMPDFKATAEKAKATVAKAKTMDRKKLIVCGVAAVLALLLIIFNITAIANTAMKVVMSDEDYYKYVEMKEMKKIVGIVGDKYGDYINLFSDDTNSSEMGISITVGNELRNYLQSYAGIDFSWLTEIKLTAGGTSGKDGVGSGNAQLNLGDSTIMSSNVYMDKNEGVMYIQIPELDSRVANMSMVRSGMVPNIALGGINSMDTVELMYKIIEECPDRAALEKILIRYLDAFIEGVTKVEKDDGKLSAGGVSKKYTVYEVSITPQTNRKAMLNVLTELRKDKEVKELIIDIVPLVDPSLDGRLVYDELMSEVEWYIDDLRSSDYDYYDYDDVIVMEVYVDAKGEVAGRKLIYDGEIFVIAMPEDGKEVGFEISYSDGYDRAAIIGSGEKSGNKLGGKYEVTVNGAKLLSVKVSDYDTKAADNGDIYGKFTFDIKGADVDMLYDILYIDYSALSMAANYSVVVESKVADGFGFDVSATVVNGSNEDVISANIYMSCESGGKANKIDGMETSVPLEDWSYGLDEAKFREYLYSILPAEIVDAIMYGGFGAVSDTAPAGDDYYQGATNEAWPEEEW